MYQQVCLSLYIEIIYRKGIIQIPIESRIIMEIANSLEEFSDRSRYVRHCSAISNEAINTLRAVEETWTGVRLWQPMTYLAASIRAAYERLEWDIYRLPPSRSLGFSRCLAVEVPFKTSSLLRTGCTRDACLRARSDPGSKTRRRY